MANKREKEDKNIEVYQESLPIIEMLLPAWFATQNKSVYSGKAAENFKKGIRTPYQEKILKLIREFSRKLVENGEALSRKQLKALDRIDMRELLPEENSRSYDFGDLRPSKEDKEFSVKYGWMSGIPCFEKGVIQYRDNRYLYFEIQDIYLEEKEVCLLLKDYAYYPQLGWLPGAECEGTIMTAKNPEEGYDMMPVTFADLSYIWRFTLKQENLGWSDADIKAWTEFAVQMEAVVTGQIEQTQKLQISLMQIFSGAIVKINRTLAENKASKPQKAVPGEKSEIVLDPQMPTRRIRKVGKMIVQSEKVPKLPTKERVIHYRTAAWTVRGHTRALKSGRTIYINPKTHHRQCMKDGSGEVAKTTIVLNKK